MCSPEPLNCALAAIGTDRVMFAADYPFESVEEAGQFLDEVPIGDSVRADIAYRTAASRLGLAAP
jgi:2,3-dihydroxybenzoate decarboxylase